MWKTFSIAKKIWLSFSILVIGYSVSILLGFRLGQQTELRLRNVSESLFTAATQSQVALTAFNEQIKSYNSAVLMEDESLFESAQQEAATVQQALHIISGLAGLDVAYRNTVGETLAQFQEFTVSATTVYGAMSLVIEVDVSDEDSLEKQAFQLAQDTTELQETLAGFTSTFAEVLKQELSNISKATRKRRYTELVSFLGVILTALLVTAIFTKRSILTPVRHLADIASRIAVGDLSAQITLTSRDELGIVANAFREMIAYIREVADVAQKLAVGEIQVRLTPKSEQDVLNQAFSETVQYMQNVTNIAERISRQDLQVTVTPKSKEDLLNLSLQRMVTNLQTMMAEIETSMNSVQQLNWIRTGQAELNSKLRGEQDIATLASGTISYLAAYLNAQIGAVYLLDHETQLLTMVGSYAYTKRKENYHEIPLGKGLVGQAALAKEQIIFRNVPEDYSHISSGLGGTVPRHILVLPFLYEERVKGVIELGAVHAFTERELELLEYVLESIAIAFHSAEARVRMQQLLEETQRQTQELQFQQNQLAESNKELEDQARVLHESEEKLRVQQEELRQTNEELARQRSALEQQQQGLQGKNRELERVRHEIEQKALALELASRYKSEFLANMSHELRTPLNSMLILSKLLASNKGGHLTPKQVQSAQTVYASGTDLLGLINDVLDLSKVEAGKMILHVEDMKLNGLVNYVRQHFQHVTDEKGLALHVDLAEGLPEFIQTDRQRVEQIIRNLLSNAIKFTSEGAIRVTIERPASHTVLSNSRLSPEHAIAVAVRDTGIGIPGEKQQLIFEAFQQVDGTTNRKYGGTGLGLSISREFSVLLGGEVQLRSTVGEGSTFTLYLPESLDVETQEEGMNVNVHRASQAPLTGSDMIRDDRHDASPTDKFLLIIEPDLDIAKHLFDLGRDKGFKGLVAADGSAGLQLAYQYKLIAIMLDLNLPDIDGNTVLERLQEHLATQHIPIHLISAAPPSVGSATRDEVDYLVKPITTEKLEEAFQRIEEITSKHIKKLLVVEDDPQIRDALFAMLQSEDVLITNAETTQEMLNVLESENFDCVVLDLELKDLEEDIVDRIKEKVRTSQLPVIAFTGQELTKADEMQLKQYIASIIVKDGRALERLLDEVTLFLHHIESDVPDSEVTRPRMFREKETLLKDKTVLLVDDDMRNVFALINVFEEQGMTVLAGDTGKKALELLETHPEIDVVLMDIMMPEMDGYETMRQIRRQTRFRALPVIALTAKAMKGDRQKCLDAGANDYLSKPIDTDKLLSLLRVWLYK